jgi:predicted FMN-binding regulatory protein PaiB
MLPCGGAFQPAATPALEDGPSALKLDPKGLYHAGPPRYASPEKRCPMPDFTSKYEARSEADTLRLLREQPMAWVHSQSAGGPLATVLPLRPVLSKEGRLVALKGHFARANPHVAALRANPRASVLLLGAHGYISPSWMADRTQAPSWNYVSAWFETDIRLIDDPQDVVALMRDMVETMEAGRPNAWSLEDMGPRYEKLARGVVGFESRILAAHPRFKLSQDDRDDVYIDIHHALEEEDPALLSWMNTFNPGRGPK